MYMKLEISRFAKCPRNSLVGIKLIICNMKLVSPIHFFRNVKLNEEHSVSAKIKTSHALKIAWKLLPIHKYLKGETKFILMIGSIQKP